MEYAKLTETYIALEATSSRLEMASHLAELFRTMPPELLQRVVYLLQGKVAPDYEGLEVGLAEKLILRALAFTTGLALPSLEEQARERGDLGEVAQWALKRKKQRALFNESLTVKRVFTNLARMARLSGTGTQDTRQSLLAQLLHDAEPTDGKFIIRTVTGNLRLGVGDATIIEGLAEAFVEREAKGKLEHAYNRHPDQGGLAETVARDNIEGVEAIGMEPGVPLRSMLAERLPSLEAIMEKLGRAAFDYKYDGLRIQAHVIPKASPPVLLFSRRLEDITGQFPDVCETLAQAFQNTAAIVEGEAVPVDPESGNLLPFQVISRRRGRKYDLDQAQAEVPVRLYLFDCLYLEGEDLTSMPFETRRAALESSFQPTDSILCSDLMVADTAEAAEQLFDRALEFGCEGLIAKALGEDSLYRAGARGWQWIKFKADYTKSALSDTLDLVVVGGFAGRGRRAGGYGALLMAAYNDETQRYETVCKLGSGFDDNDLAEIPGRVDPHRAADQPASVVSDMQPDVWFEPVVVLEVLAAEVTRSPIHTCGRKLEGEPGYALRFPRFANRYREDKGAEQATTTGEVIELYGQQVLQEGNGNPSPSAST